MSNPYKRIYYIEGKVLFSTQIVVTRELDEESHIWLKALSERLKKDDIRNLLEGVNRLTEKIDKELADSVLEVSIGANKQIIEEMMGDDSVCHALMEIMEPVIQEKVWKEIKKGIQMTIDTLREFGHGDAEIRTAIMRKYDISDEEVEEYL